MHRPDSQVRRDMVVAISAEGLGCNSVGSFVIMSSPSCCPDADYDDFYGILHPATRIGILIEDQVAPKSCGHVKGKRVVGRDEAVSRIRAAADARCGERRVSSAR